MEPDYLDILIQWLFFFALISIFLLPAFLFRKAARLTGRSGWQSFLVGLAIGMAITQLARLPLTPFTKLEDQKLLQQYLPLVYLALSYLLVYLSVVVFKRIVS